MNLSSEEADEFQMIMDALEESPLSEEQVQQIVTDLKKDTNAILSMPMQMRLLLRKAEALARLIPKQTLS